VSSCDAGTTTTATGLDIVTGTQLTQKQTHQPTAVILGASTVPLGPIGPDPHAQAVSRAARTGAIAALVAIALGACLVVGLHRFWRAAGAIAAAVAFIALAHVGITATGSPAGAPSGSWPPAEGVSLEAGFLLASAVVFATMVGEVWAIIWAGSSRCSDQTPHAGTQGLASPKLSGSQPEPGSP
jgi:hypothetical protein